MPVSFCAGCCSQSRSQNSVGRNLLPSCPYVLAAPPIYIHPTDSSSSSTSSDKATYGHTSTKPENDGITCESAMRCNQVAIALDLGRTRSAALVSVRAKETRSFTSTQSTPLKKKDLTRPERERDDGPPNSNSEERRRLRLSKLTQRRTAFGRPLPTSYLLLLVHYSCPP